jgi:hypothetical protein
MRLRIGLALATVAILCVLTALPAAWYGLNVVGPNFMIVGVNEDPHDGEIRELNGEWSLWDYEISNSTFRERLPDPMEYEDPMFVAPVTDEEIQPPNANAIDVVSNTSVLASGAVIVMALGVFGAWNIARYDRFRAFTSASFFLAALLLLGACFYFGSSLPDAMQADAATGDEYAFGYEFEKYVDTDGELPAYYNDFSGGYPDQTEFDGEQLQYGPGSGWWLAGSGGILALVASAVLFGAPQWQPLRRKSTQVKEVLRYVPVPTVATLRQRRRYPKRMPAVNRVSPGYRKMR